MADLKTRIKEAAARLWGKPINQVHLEHRPESNRAEVYVWIDEEDPDKGRYMRQVFIWPQNEAEEASPAYALEILFALLDVVEGALKRAETTRARIARSVN